MKNSEDLSNKVFQNDEIDLIELTKSIWSEKWFIAKVTAIFMVLGLIIAFTSPNEYKATTILIPEAIGEEGKLGGSLGGLASLAGVDLGGLQGGSQTINPGLYQSVAKSTPFLIELMNQRFYFSELGDTVKLYDYYQEHLKTSLVSKIMRLPSQFLTWIKPTEEAKYVNVNTGGVIALSLEEQRVLEDLKERIFVEMDWDLNIVRMEAEMQDPQVVAQITNFTRDYITDYVTQYAISKSQKQLSSIEAQYEERKQGFELAQLKLATFRDNNKNVTTARARSEEERLQSEYNLAFNVYNQLAQQREAIKLQIQENTPVFTVLEPSKIPNDKFKPKKGLLISKLILVGIFFGVLIIITKKWIIKSFRD